MLILYRRENQETRKLSLLLKETKIIFGFHHTQPNAIFDAIKVKRSSTTGQGGPRGSG